MIEKFKHLLPEIYRKLAYYFPGNTISTEVLEEGNYKTLVIYVHISEDVDNALNMLDKFDKEWWTVSPNRCQPNICVTLKFEEGK